MLDPLLILLIGIVAVIGLIIVLRVNAFIALVAAAMLVSLLSPGDWVVKISRVALEFGKAAGSIGIVIALAAVIGKCLMDSGAADKIVRSFLRVLGEKRASTALMGSGFVLAVPVFFDTVFYLLVPLARSLYRRNHKNYVLYVTAIGAGAAITHTLVPPTPGPLFIASALGIDLGMMIMMGTVVALPTAIVGLMACHVINRLMDIPMRNYDGEVEPEPLADEQLPGLFVSILPVVLPVILIAANTLTTTFADAEHAALLRPGDVSNWRDFASTLTNRLEGDEPSPAKRVWDLLPDSVRSEFREAAAGGELDPPAKQHTLAAMNDVLRNPKFYELRPFVDVDIPPSLRTRLAGDLTRTPKAELEHLNRLLLEASFPDQIRAHLWETPRRKAANVTAVPGDPNLALLISAVIAMLVLVRNRGLSLKELGQATETALMSGGVIILITAGGGAFGAMLREAGVQGSVESLVDLQGQSVGTVILSTAFFVAAVLKIAQGSSTVAMITTSSMFAAMGVTSGMLGCHMVYLATAIGCGSLVGSWMNDSGFWIFSKMGALSEVETLKAWSTLLVVLGTTGLGFTLLFAWLLPLG
jgi:H+/gluconate symporter-like permease